MVARFVQDGRSIDYTPGAAVAAGDVVVQGDLLGIAKVPIAANALGALAVEGVYEMPKATGVGAGIAAGAKVYWKAASKVVQADSESGANKYVGKVVKAAADGDATVLVRLEQ